MRLDQFLDAARATPPAVVLVSGNATGVGILRALGRHGVPLWALGPNAESVVLHSRDAYGSTCADPFYDEAGFIRDLVQVGRRLPQRAVLIPTDDDVVTVLPRHADTLREWFILTQPSPEHVQALWDKGEQVRAAWRAGVDTPATAFIRGEGDLEEAAAHVPFPAVLKSAKPLAFLRRAGIKVLTVARPEDLPAVYGRVRDFGDLILQEFVPGDDTMLYNYGSYLDARSRPLAEFTRRKLRQHPRTFGEIRFGESVWVPEVAAAGLRLLQEMHYHGISGVEFKLDQRDGRYKLMEVNARTTIVSHTLAPYVGVDIPYVAYRDAIGRPVTAPRQRDGARLIQCSTDVPDSLIEILRGEMRLGAWLRSLRGTRVDGIMALDDPVPGLLDAVGVARYYLRRYRARSSTTRAGAARG